MENLVKKKFFANSYYVAEKKYTIDKKILPANETERTIEITLNVKVPSVAAFWCRKNVVISGTANINVFTERGKALDTLINLSDDFVGVLKDRYNVDLKEELSEVLWRL